MRVLIILVAVLLLLAMLGWITFHSEPDRSSINLETGEIREDTGELMRRGSELMRGAEAEITRETPGGVDKRDAD